MPEDGILKERYTAAELDDKLAELEAAGLLDPDDPDLSRLVGEFYFRGLVHGRADPEKIDALREELGY